MSFGISKQKVKFETIPVNYFLFESKAVITFFLIQNLLRALRSVSKIVIITFCGLEFLTHHS